MNFCSKLLFSGGFYPLRSHLHGAQRLSPNESPDMSTDKT